MVPPAPITTTFSRFTPDAVPRSHPTARPASSAAP
jgi:hypothetical protein